MLIVEQANRFSLCERPAPQQLLESPSSKSSRVCQVSSLAGLVGEPAKAPDELTTTIPFHPAPPSLQTLFFLGKLDKDWTEWMDCASFLIVLDSTQRGTWLWQVWAFEREFSEILRGKGWDSRVEGRTHVASDPELLRVL